MKLPSLLKIPTHSRYTVQPRYYDPVKEDIKIRTDRIKKLIEVREKEGKLLKNENDTSSIQGSFGRDSYYKKKPNTLRFSIMILLAGGAAGYLYFGNIALYGTISLILVYYLYKKFRPKVQ